MVELYINGKLVDLGDADFQVDYAVAKIGDLTQATGARSTSFDLPKTANNRLIFDNPSEVNGTSLKPYSRIPCMMFVDGIDQQLLFAVLTSTKDVYSVNLYGVNVDFFKLIDGKLTDIDFSEYDYYHTLTNYVATRTDLNICKSISKNFASPSAITIGDVRYLPPSLGYEFALEKICEAQGYTLNNQTKAVYGYPNQLMLLPTCKEWLRDLNGKKYECEFYGDTTLIPGVASTNRILLLDKISGDDKYFDSNALASWNGLSFLLNDVIEVDYDITVTIDVTIPADFTIVVNSIGINNLIPFANIVVGTNTFNYTGTATLTPSGIYSANDIFIEVSMVFGGSYTGMTGRVKISNVEVITPTAVDPTPSTFLSRQYCAIGGIIPDVKQSDLLKTYLNLTGSIVQVDNGLKQVTILPFQSIVNNIANSVDWSNKLDLTEEPEITYLADGYGQTNTFKWKYDELIDPNETATFADGSFSINDQSLEDIVDLVEIDFSASTQALISGFTVVDLSNLFDSVGVFADELEQRIIFGKFTDVAFTYTDGTSNIAQTTDILLTHFQKSTEDYNLGFDYNIIPNFYKGLTDVLDRFKQVKCLVRVSASDINKLDFTKPVYIQYFNAYFYLSVVESYTPTAKQSTSVELVKLF